MQPDEILDKLEFCGVLITGPREYFIKTGGFSRVVFGNHSKEPVSLNINGISLFAKRGQEVVIPNLFLTLVDHHSLIDKHLKKLAPDMKHYPFQWEYKKIRPASYREFNPAQFWDKYEKIRL